MTRVREKASFCTVIVTVDADSAVMADLEAHARDGLARFAERAGFISGALHRSADGARLVQYLQWQTEAHHLACMNDPAWDGEESTRRFMALVESGAAKIDVRTYDVVRVVDAPANRSEASAK